MSLFHATYLACEVPAGSFVHPNFIERQYNNRYHRYFEVLYPALALDRARQFRRELADDSFVLSVALDSLQEVDFSF